MKILTQISKLEEVFEHPRSHEILAIIVILNACVLGLETSITIKESGIYKYLLILDHIFLTFFGFEMLVRLITFRGKFFKNGWNIFDFLIIGIALLPYTQSFSIFRALRVLRVLWLIELFPNMRKLITAVHFALPGILNVAAILIVLFYLFAVIATNLFGHTHPILFGHIGITMKTLFQLMIGDGWGEITNSVHQQHPFSFMLFIPFVLIISFTILNLFIGLIVDGMQNAAMNNKSEPVDETTNERILKELQEIKQLIKQIHNQ